MKWIVSSPIRLILVVVCAAALILVATSLIKEMLFERGIAAMKYSDAPTAIGYLRPLAWLGDARAAHFIAVIYVRGLGVPRNHTEALHWLEKAYSPGDLAKEFLGTGAAFEAGGDGFGSPDLHEAAYWYCLAANRGDPTALSRLREPDLSFASGCIPSLSK